MLKVLNKSDLYSETKLAFEETGKELPKATINELLNVCFSVLEKALATGHGVIIPNVGTIKIKPRAEHNARNPQTGEAITVPPQNVLRFKPTLALRNTVKNLELD